MTVAQLEAIMLRCANGNHGCKSKKKMHLAFCFKCSDLFKKAKDANLCPEVGMSFTRNYLSADRVELGPWPPSPRDRGRWPRGQPGPFRSTPRPTCAKVRVSRGVGRQGARAFLTCALPGALARASGGQPATKPPALPAGSTRRRG